MLNALSILVASLPLPTLRLHSRCGSGACGFGFGIWGLGFEVRGLGCGVWGLGSGVLLRLDRTQSGVDVEVKVPMFELVSSCIGNGFPKLALWVRGTALTLSLSVSHSLSLSICLPSLSLSLCLPNLWPVFVSMST